MTRAVSILRHDLQNAGEWRAQWEALYRNYADFYQSPMDEARLEAVWQWLNEGRLRGVLAANAAGEALGFAHWQIILRPLKGERLAYLHDLYVAEDGRKKGVGAALIEHARTAAAAAGCGLLRWATRADNLPARRLYDKIAAATDWVIYETGVDDA